MSQYARIFDGKVAELFETDGDITEMFHPDLIWIEIPSGLNVSIDWTWSADSGFSAPAAPTPQEIKYKALTERSALLIWAGQQIAPLQDAVDLDEATEAELVKLKEWKQYRVSLSRLDQQAGWPADIQWPVAPEVD
ncbi:tail fiber assembly protein [Pseudomonas nitroreducens]|nr:tail fiber assembly protein [Pseudomonas nitroreducens]